MNEPGFAFWGLMVALIASYIIWAVIIDREEP